MCFNSLSHPACKAHAPCYTVICGLSGCTIFFNISLVWWLYLPAFFFLLKLAGVMSYSYTAVGIATRYGLDSLGIESLVGETFSALVQTGPGAHPASYTMGTGSFPGVNWPGRGVDHPPQSSAEVGEKIELYICSPSGPSWPVLGWTLRYVLFINYILATLPESKVSIPDDCKRFSLLKNAQTASGVHPASCWAGTGKSFSCLKAAEAWSYLAPCSAEVKYVRRYACAPPYAFILSCIISTV